MFKRLVRPLFAPDEPPQGEPAPAEPAAPATPELAEPPVPADPPEPAEPPEPAHVPVAALKDERQKRQKLAEENAYLRGQLEATSRQPAPAAPAEPATPAAPQAPVPPNIDDFDDIEDFNKADRAYIVAQAKYEIKQEFEQSQQQHSRQLTEAQTIKEFQKRLNAEAELDPEITTIASTFHIPGHPNHMPLTLPMQDAIKESEVGPQLLRHFANNKPLVAKLAAMTPNQVLREIGRIEATIINKPPPAVKHVSAAPEPVKPVTPSGGPEPDDDTISMTEYLAREKAKRQARQRR
jgi:hypothetical protein